MRSSIGKIFVVAGVLAVFLAVLLNQTVAGQSHYAKAVDHLKTAIDLKLKRDLIGAEAHYREAIRLEPGYAEAHYSYAILLADRGDINGAISESKKAIEIEKNYPEAHFNLAGYLRKKGDRDGEIK